MIYWQDVARARDVWGLSVQNGDVYEACAAVANGVRHKVPGQRWGQKKHIRSQSPPYILDGAYYFKDGVAGHTYMPLRNALLLAYAIKIATRCAYFTVRTNGTACYPKDRDSKSQGRVPCGVHAYAKAEVGPHGHATRVQRLPQLRQGTRHPQHSRARQRGVRIHVVRPVRPMPSTELTELTMIIAMRCCAHVMNTAACQSAQPTHAAPGMHHVAAWVKQEMGSGCKQVRDWCLTTWRMAGRATCWPWWRRLGRPGHLLTGRPRLVPLCQRY